VLFVRLSIVIGRVEGNVAPALQAAREQLQRSQLEVRVMIFEDKRRLFNRRDTLYQDKLDQKLLQRPKPDELVKSGILKRKYIPTVAVP
jgi:hypothetical protein